MTKINIIQDNIKKELELLKATEKSKQHHQWIIESLAETILRAELNLFRWEKQIQIFRKHPNYVQLAGIFHVETAVLLKEKIILCLNHFLDTSGVSINYLFKKIERNKISVLNADKDSDIKKQIAKDKIIIENIRKNNVGLINYRHQKIAHNGIENLGKKFEDYKENFTPEIARKLILEFKEILNFYINIFNIQINYSLENNLKSQSEIGFETDIEDLISVVEQAFDKLNFSSEKIQRIANDYKIQKKIQSDFKKLDN